MIEVTVEGLAIELATNSPVVILVSNNLQKALLIWIDPAEGAAISNELINQNAFRLMTHDSLISVVEEAKGYLDKVEIVELKNNTFYAKLYMVHNKIVHEIGVLPSEAITLALRFKVKIFVDEKLLNRYEQEVPKKSQDSKNPKESLRDSLKKIKPEDFGKYSL